MSIGSNIARMRRAKGMTQEALAKRIGVARQTVAKWEGGTAIPDLTNAQAIAQTLEITLDGLVGASSDVAEDTTIMLGGERYFGTCKLGSYGTVRIPEKALEVFDFHTGDELVVLGNGSFGIGVCKIDSMRAAVEELGQHLGV